MVNVIFNQFDYEISERKQEVWDKYNKIIQWGRCHPLRFAEKFLETQFTDHQKYIFLSTWQAKFVTWVMARNSGKMTTLTTKIYSENRSCKTVGELKLGDKIYNPSGELVEVIHLNPILVETVYQVICEDGEQIECGAEHLWSVYKTNDSKVAELLIDTKSLYKEFKMKIKDSFYLPTVKPIQYSEKKLSVSPYLFGGWIAQAACNQRQNLERIPEEYLTSSIKQRQELLYGIMDAIGFVTSKGNVMLQIDLTHKQLSKDICALLSELGFINIMSQQYGNFYIKIKATQQNSCFKYSTMNKMLPVQNNTMGKKIVDVIKTNSKKPMRCITVSGDDGLFLCGEKATPTHNSFLSAPYIMTRSMLIPNHKSYIMSVTGNQAQETFKKMEDLAMGQIASLANTSQVFLGEVIKQNARDSGFTHDKNSWSTSLYNGSEVHTLNSVPQNIVGMRSNLNLYDEAGKIGKEFFALTKPFTTQNTNFITGPNINVKCYPMQFPTQIILCSSAEDIFTELWESYRLGAQEMIMGNKDYFVCDIDCNFSLHPKMNGEDYTPLLTQSTIDEALAKNAFRAHREYYNKFDVTGGQDAVVSKSKLMKCSQGYMPVFEWEPDKRYIIVNDPSSKIDNSFVLVAEIFKDEERGWMAKIVNGHNLIEVTKSGEKKVIQKPQQIEIIKEYLVNYNGPANDYDNLEQVIIDAGAGGGGFDMYQFILPGWVDNKGEHHVGIIDPNDKYCIQVSDQFPEAKEILTLANFRADKIAMYDATMDALNQELIIFPKDATGRGEMEFEDTDADGKIVYRYERLNKRQLSAITEIELMKYELMSMEKTKNTSTNRITFDLMPSKKSEGLHDDRADCMAMLCFYLMKLRSQDKLNQFKSGRPDFTKIKTAQRQYTSGRFSLGNNPFANRGANPFA